MIGEFSFKVFNNTGLGIQASLLPHRL